MSMLPFLHRQNVLLAMTTVTCTGAIHHVQVCHGSWSGEKWCCGCARTLGHGQTQNCGRPSSLLYGWHTTPHFMLKLPSSTYSITFQFFHGKNMSDCCHAIPAKRLQNHTYNTYSFLYFIKRDCESDSVRINSKILLHLFDCVNSINHGCHWPRKFLFCHQICHKPETKHNEIILKKQFCIVRIQFLYCPFSLYRRNKLISYWASFLRSLRDPGQRTYKSRGVLADKLGETTTCLYLSPYLIYTLSSVESLPLLGVINDTLCYCGSPLFCPTLSR